MINQDIQNISGPILVIGAGGFVGATLFRTIRSVRNDCYGVARRQSSRIKDETQIEYFDILHFDKLDLLLKRLSPKTIINLASYGNNPSHSDFDRMVAVNTTFVQHLLEKIKEISECRYIHIGTSSEYGVNCAEVEETALPMPNSFYAMTKLTGHHLVQHYARAFSVKCLSLRLFSVYGPEEESYRLIPKTMKAVKSGTLPVISNPEISRDFIHVEDVVVACLKACIASNDDIWGGTFNVCTGIETSLREFIEVVKREFKVEQEISVDPKLARPWDITHWSGDPRKTLDLLGFKAEINLAEGLRKTFDSEYEDVTFCEKQKISFVVACYNDQDHIELLYEKICNVTEKLGLLYEIIFVNDASPDKTEFVIASLTKRDPNVIGINHPTNFGTQAGFLSGMELTSGDFIVLMDGDLQDPPEVIEKLYLEWQKTGTSMILAKRTSREEPSLLQTGRKIFYRLLKLLGSQHVVLDVGDFALMEKAVARYLIQCKERNPFWRTIRTEGKFSYSLVSYHRPARFSGESTNSIKSNLRWAIYGFMSVNHKLFVLYLLGAFLLSFIAYHISFSTVVSLSTLYLFIGIGLIGIHLKYLLAEKRERPLFVRSSIIRNGKVYHE